jgi:tripartite-type tricarboxylate transporter receptor subunit TctC
MKIVKGWTILAFALAILFGIFPSSGLASSDYPSRPIEIVVPYSPGGGADIASRVFKDYVGKILGQPVIQTFKPGAGGATGSAFVAAAKPDGYTLLVGSNSPLVVAPLTKKPGYTLNDFTPVCNYTLLPLLWVVKDDSPYKTMQDFIRAAKTKKMKYATYGSLTAAHVCMEALQKVAGFQAIHVPYDGGGRTMTAVLGGHADIGIASGSGGMAGPGRLRILAIGHKERLDLLPDVPTLKEIGYPVYGIIYYGLWGPKGVPKEIVEKVYGAHKRVVNENGKEIAKILNGLEHTVALMGPEELWEEYQADYEFQKKVLGEMGALHK